MLCRYQYEARRQANGEWRITRMQVNLGEIMQAEGFYPGGQRDGR